jgi:FlaA1/EpsC-like NDP-sugar epimerase
MGTPVKIVDLAHNMIRLSGKEPGRDVKIEFIGARPGEKLHEELWGEGEQAVPTSHPKILRCAGRPVDPAWLEEELAELQRLMDAGDTLEVVTRISTMTRAPKRLQARAAEPV